MKSNNVSCLVEFSVVLLLIMADDDECDVVVSNGEVYVERRDFSNNPSSILQNVEQTCNKIMIPSMAQSAVSAMSKLSGSDPHPDVIFSTLKEVVSDAEHEHQQHDDDHDDHEDSIVIKSSDDDDKRVVRLSQVSNGGPQGQTRVVKWTLETMAMAMDSVLCGKMTTTNAARKYGIPRTTLLDRLAMKVKRQHIDAPGSFPLNAENDAKIVDFIRKNSDLDKSTLLKGILAMAEELARDQGKPFDNPLVTRKWLKLFVHKHPSLDILKFSRPRNIQQGPPQNSQRSPVTTITHTPIVRSNSHSSSNNQEVLLSPHIIHIQNNSNGHTPQSHHENELEHEEQESVESTSMEMQQIYDSFESNLARLAAEAVERKLNSEQCAYFNYRFYNNAIERGFELWKLCKSKTDTSNDQENFETVLSAQALVAIEQALVPEHLKYFRFRYENQELEEGYKLWSVLKEKSHS